MVETVHWTIPEALALGTSVFEKAGVSSVVANSISHTLVSADCAKLVGHSLGWTPDFAAQGRCFNP